MGRLKRILLVLASALLLIPNTAQATGSKISVSGLDTVASFETLVKADFLSPGQSVSFLIKKPDGNGVIKLRTTADSVGHAEVTVGDSETKVAGIYAVSLDSIVADLAEFQVFPGEMSPEVSGLYSNKAYVAGNGVDYARVNVRVADQFGNPLEFHEIKLVSSRSADKIVAANSETDAKGLASFIVSSVEFGVSVFTATDESAQTTLGQRVKIIFTKAAAVYKEIGGDPKTVLLAQAGPSVSRFQIDNIPASVKVNETVSFSIVASNDSGTVVNSYTGTVVFSSTDPNVQLPNTYTFKTSDQGRKTFDLGLTFRSVGSQKLIIQQQGNPLIKGEKAVEVVNPIGGNNSGQVRITKPATGTYSVNTLEVAGEASANARVRIFDNGQQVSEVQSNSSGRFSYNTSLLTDGQHTFNAESNGVSSVPVVVTIDSTPAQIEQVEITPMSLAPGETAKISLRSDVGLNSVQATIGDLIVDLDPDFINPGVYRGTLTAPAQDGDYTVNVIITDKVGNVSPATEVGKIRVDASLKEDSGSTFSVPSKVTGVQATGGKAKVLLTWQPSQAEAGIALYRIYYGTDKADLNLISNSKDAVTSWTVENLQNGTIYFFQVVGVDKNGVEGDNRSDPVSAMPSSTAPDGTTGGSPVLCDPSPCPPDAGYPPATPDDGPEVLGMIFSSIAVGSVVQFFRRKRKM
ncbi:Ig-like domain-containing protein [Candidatus Peregrinibacteria bacterium]|nr:Ig-like domain-containing protein [Candidatus Peregrinibacteria bacterium]